MRKIYLSFIFLLLSIISYPQSFLTVRGVVTDIVTGAPLSRVTITAKENKLSVSTGADGRFVVNVLLTDTLILSHIGYETRRVAINGSGEELKISLLVKDYQLEEVIINTGYQQLKPNEVNGSFSTINNAKLNEQKGTNILDRLNGVTPGLLFKTGKNSSTLNSPAVISIRGESTINGPLDPLIIVDNFPYDGSIDNINPNDVENITVLKDAAATSIYGAKGGNGVIVITTKKGRFNSHPTVSLSSNTIITPRPDLYLYQQLSSSDFINMEEYLFNKGYYNNTLNSTAKQSVSPAVEIFFKRRNMAINAADSAAMIDYLKKGDARRAYFDLYSHNTVVLQNSLAVRGGNKYIAWMLATNYDKTKSYDRSINDRLNIRISNSLKIGKNVIADFGANYTINTAGAGSPAYNSIRNGNYLLPYLRFTDEEGKPVAVAKDYRLSYTDTAGAGRLQNWNYYPATDNNFIKDKNIREDITGTLGMSIHITDGLDFYANYQYQKQSTVQHTHYTEQSYYARNLINRYTQLGATAATDIFRVPKGGILNVNNSRSYSQNGRGQLAYNKRWAGLLTSFSALAGMELRESIGDGNSLSFYGYQEDPLTNVNVDYNTLYRTYINGALAALPNPPRLTPVNTNRFVSFYGNMTFTVLKRFSFSSSMRRDAANIFGLKTNDKWNPFWSAGMGWEISREKFFNKRILNYLKLRATLGTSGIVNPNRTADAIVRFSTDNTTGFRRASVSTINNPLLRWEQSQQLNIGFDFAGIGNIVSGSIDYFRKKGKDLYGASPFNYTVWGGAQTIDLNVANMQGHGIDAMLNFKLIDRMVKYNTGVIFNYSTNKTTKYLAAGAEMVATLLGDGNTIKPVVGKPLYAIAAYKWGGLDAAGDPLGYVNGELSKDYAAIRTEANLKGIDGNIIFIGNANPVFYGAWNHSIRWRNLDLSFNLLYKMGYYFRKTALSYQALYSTGAGHSEYATRWQLAGDENKTHVPAQVYTNYPQFIQRNSFYQDAAIHVLPGDHIRFQYINLQYNHSFRQFFIKNAGINFNVANIGIIWRKNKKGLDPDYNYSSGIPQSPQFSFGINAAF